MLEIHEPIWKDRSVGVDEAKMHPEIVLLRITYRKTDGELLYPHPLAIQTKDAMKCPVQYIRGHKLRIIPIDKMVEVRR